MTTDHRHTDPKHARRQHRDDDQPTPEEPTDRTGPTADASTDPMREVSHTNPYTDESMGSLFEHGVTVVADGGKRGAADEDPDADEDAEEEAEPTTQMKDVSHEAPEGGHGNRMFERVGDTADVPDETDEDE